MPLILLALLRRDPKHRGVAPTPLELIPFVGIRFPGDPHPSANALPREALEELIRNGHFEEGKPV